MWVGGVGWLWADGRGRLAGRLAGSLAGWLAGRVAGWFGGRRSVVLLFQESTRHPSWFLPGPSHAIPAFGGMI